MACAELAPLSRRVAEVRSLVVSDSSRRVGLAARLLNELTGRARATGFETLCAFTHDARFFLRQNFSIVPHHWLPEKVATDCVGCPLFRKCGQHAMVFPLEAVARYAAQPASVRPIRVA
jgi:amino-acid N-acetyltransferase